MLIENYSDFTAVHMNVIRFDVFVLINGFDLIVFLRYFIFIGFPFTIVLLALKFMFMCFCLYAINRC